MNSRSPQFESILNDAMRVPMEQRLEFVRSASNGDVALQSRLEAAVTNDYESALATSDTTKAHSNPRSQPTFANGEKIGIYEVVEPLGQGGFGTVYKCRDETAARHVAIKVFSLNGDSDQPSGSRFEAKANAKVRHPQIARFLHTGVLESRKVEYLVYEFIDGPTLKFHLEQAKVLSAESAVKLILGLCRPLAVIHESGLTHRDLKPANVLLDSNLEPHLLDFGLAVSEVEQVHMPNHVAGTAAYMAPEQFAGNVDLIDGRTDIWAVGVIFYQLLTGVLPFKEKASIAKGHFRPPSMRVPNLPLGLDSICKKCLAVDMDRRFNSVAAFVEALNLAHPTEEGIQSGLGSQFQLGNPATANAQGAVSSENLSRASSVAKEINRPANSIALYIGILIFVLAVVATVLVIKFSNSRDSKDPVPAASNLQSSDESVRRNEETKIENPPQIANSNDRSVSQWALSRGANISINDWEEIRPGMPLPEGNFSLVAIDFEEREFGDSELETLSNFQPQNLQSIDLSSTEVTDQGMQYLLKFRQLNDLALRGTQVGDKGMDFVSEIPNLLNLYIDETLVTDKGLESFAKIKLRNLHLENVRGVTDRSAILLSEMKSLSEHGLNIGGTSITDLAIKKYGLNK